MNRGQQRAGAFLLAFCAFAAASQASSPRSFLLRIEGRVDSTFSCQGVDSETLIFHDGLVIRKAVADDGVSTFTRWEASQEAVRRLLQALGENRVGVAHGSCVVDLAQPNSFFDFTIAWFGRFGRKNVFTVTSRSGQGCPESTNAIFKAIGDFLSTASVDPGGEQVELSAGPHPCGG
jgi:hypothetical protein